MRIHHDPCKSLIRRFGFNPKTRSLEPHISYERKLRFEPCEDRRMLATFWVMDPGDDGPGTLRQAIFDANIDADHDTIKFHSDVDGAKIGLTSGSLNIKESVTITSLEDENGMPLPDGITISGLHGNDGKRATGDGQNVFLITPDFDAKALPAESIEVEFVGLTITGGDPASFHAADDGGGISFDATVGKINDTLTLRIRDCVIRDNHTQDNGGGLWMRTDPADPLTGPGPAADLYIEGSIIAGNTAGGNSEDRSGGGGAYIWGLRRAEIIDTKFIGNVSNADGGGLQAVVLLNYPGTEPELLIENSEFLGNTALTNSSPVTPNEEGGGGFWLTLGQNVDGFDNPECVVKNTTFANNRAEGDFGKGGGAWIYTYDIGTFTAINSTFSGNFAEDQGGGLWISRHVGEIDTELQFERRRVMSVRLSRAILLALLAALWPVSAAGDQFGIGDNIFEIEFVTIDNPGNPPDEDPNPAGAVPYTYRIGKYEVSEQMIDKANALGGLGITKDIRGPDMPATSVTWFEAARFVNWLNTSTGSMPAYKFDVNNEFQLWAPTDAGYDSENLYRNRLARYFLPSIDEWHKAAYYDPIAGIYYDYPTGSDSIPDGIDFIGDPDFEAVFRDGATNPEPNVITDVGIAGPYGTAGQGGNVMEWHETSFDLRNSSPLIGRVYRGGGWGNTSIYLLASGRNSIGPAFEADFFGFRVIHVPEPCSMLLLSIAATCLVFRRRQ